ncbi:MAG: hypothetical protein ACTHOO_03185 [Alcanivorax sp.]
MAEPSTVSEVEEDVATDAGPSPQDILLQQQEAQIQTARGAELTDLLIMLELLRDNEDKDMYRDADRNVNVTVMDGDSESIKPFLENSHARALEQHGGVEGLIAHRQEQFDQAVADGRMNQAVADKHIELLTAAGEDSAAYAEARFDSNDFFAEQAEALGIDPSKVNDITVTVITHTFEPGVAPTEPVIDLDLRPGSIENEDGLIKIMEGNELTEAGKVILAADGVAAETGGPNPIDMIKDKYDSLLEQHGSVEALATHLEGNMSDLMGEAALTDAGNAEVLEAVRNSDGDSANFVATMLNDIEPPPADGSAPTDPSIALLNEQQRILQEQEMSQADALALRREQAIEQGDMGALVGVTLDEISSALAMGQSGGATQTPPAEGEVTEEVALEIENRAMDIASQSLTDSPEMQALYAQIDDIKAELGEDASSHEDWHARTSPIFEQMGAMAAQVKEDARIYAANEAGVDLAKVYPDLAPQEAADAGADAESGADLDGGADVEVASVDARDTETTVPVIQPDAIDVSDGAAPDAGVDQNAEVTVEDAVDQTVEVTAVEFEEDKGYVTNPNGGPVTYEVSGVATGEPVRSEDGDLYAFSDGSGLSDGFSSASDPDPTQVAMVDPFLDAMAALDKIGYNNENNNMAFNGTMSA